MTRCETEKWLFIPYDDNKGNDLVDLEVWVLHSYYDYQYTVYVKRSTLPEGSMWLS